MKLVTINQVRATALARILSHDKRLTQSLTDNPSPQPITGNNFFKTIQKWANDCRGSVLAITRDETTIGCLGYVPLSAHCALVNLWLRSDLWNQGLATQAIGLFLPMARDQGFHYLTANIARENLAACALWNKHSVIQIESTHYYHYWMDLHENLSDYSRIQSTARRSQISV